MFKLTIVIAALAVSASLAISLPEQRQFAGQRQQMQGQWEMQRDPMAAAATIKQKPTKVTYVTEVKQAPSDHGIIELLESAVLKLVKIPKKVVTAIVSLIVGKFKSLSAKGLLKTALLAGLVSVLAAVAAVLTISVTGLVSLISGLCAIALHFKSSMGGYGGIEQDAHYAESNIDYVTDFVLSSFDKYGEKQ